MTIPITTHVKVILPVVQNGFGSFKGEEKVITSSSFLGKLKLGTNLVFSNETSISLLRLAPFSLNFTTTESSVVPSALLNENFTSSASTSLPLITFLIL